MAGEGWAGEEKRKGRRRGERGKWRGGKGRAPELLLNRGPSEPCYATDYYRKLASLHDSVLLLHSEFTSSLRRAHGEDGGWFNRLTE